MVAVSKSKTGTYYEQDRVWEEAKQCGLPPFYIGRWKGNYKIPDDPSKDVFRELAQGRPLKRVQKNRVAVFDHTFSWDKSVTIATYGMTPPDKWGGWTKEFADVVRKVMEPRLASQVAKTGAQGKDKEPSKGLALTFPGWRGAFGQLNAHVHAVVFNLTATKDGKAYSLGNSHESFRDQALMRAIANKLMDDRLRANGFTTERKGNRVAVKGVPEDMARALSPSRAAMDEARKSQGHRGPRAEDFAASKANRAGKKATATVTPEQAYAHVQETAKRYGVTVEKLKASGSTPLDPLKAQHVAYDVALKARDVCTKRYGSFTTHQYLRWVFTLGIGRDTTYQALIGQAKMLLRLKSLAGIEKTVTEDGQVRYHVPVTQEMNFSGATKAQGKATAGPQPDPRETLKAAERPYVREAWQDLKAAVKGLGGAVLVATARKATDIVKGITEAVNPAAKTLRIDAADLDQFLVKHHRTNFAVAHVKAFFRGLLAGGNPHQMAAVGERAYAALRAYTPLPKNTVIIVERGHLATADQLRKLAKVAKRDKCSVVLSERPEPHRAFVPPKQKTRQQRVRQSLRKHGFKPSKDRIH